MKITSVSIDHHKVLGTTKIKMFGNSEDLTENILQKHHTDIHLEIDQKADGNHFTYIIGQNGIGKTLLFRSIIHYINWNNENKDDKLKDFINLYPYSAKYLEIYAKDLGYNELSNLGIYNKYFVNPHSDNNDFLSYYKSQLISISSYIDKSIINKNPRFRSFNYTSEINKIERLFLKSLLRFKNTSEIQTLNQLLQRKNPNWKIRCEIASEAAGKINDDTYTVLLKNKNRVNIFLFFKTLENIQLNKEGQILTDNLNEKEAETLKTIYNSGLFFQLYHESNISFSQLLFNIKNSKTIKKIKEVLKTFSYEGSEQSLNIRLPEKQQDEWENLFDLEDLNNFEASIIALLSYLELLDLQVLCNDIPINRLSSGEQNILRIFSYFSDLPIPDLKENLIVFFDEPENSLHPKWQQDFPVYFKTIVEEVYKIKNSHFIFATHSPVLLMRAAQIPNSNVLQFSKDLKNKFTSKQIENVNSFSIEEVLLDEFKISYRSKEKEIKIENELNIKISENTDPIDSITDSFELREKLNELFKKYNDEQ